MSGYETARDGKWVGLIFDDHIRICNDGVTRTRVTTVGEKGFEFRGKNPLKLPKKIQQWVNDWLEKKCRERGMAVWDCEAWVDYENTEVVQ